MSADPEPKPPPLKPSRYTKSFWDACASGVLQTAHCRDCGHLFLPPGPVCPRCWSRALDTRRMSGDGSVVTFTVYRQSYHRGLKPPLVVALIELVEGPRLVSNVVGCAPKHVRIGMPVRVRFDRRGDYTLPRFVPATGRVHQPAKRSSNGALSHD